MVFENFLGLDYQIKFSNKITNYSILLKNNNRVILSDSFFSKLTDKDNYLNEECIPDDISWVNNDLFIENDFPIFYGAPTLTVTNRKIECNFDLFAIVFFMLTRWEEYVLNDRDEHDRFSAFSSMAYKNNFLHRPIVNEAIEFLWNCFIQLGCSQKRRARVYKVIPTHDVDMIRDNNKVRGILRVLLKYKKLNIFSNPYNDFQRLMDISDQGNTMSHFYFMGADKLKQKYDGRYDASDPFVKKCVKNIVERGHVVGFHPGYSTYINGTKFKSEKINLENNINFELKNGRHHYLRFKAPLTWRIWEENDLTTDSSLCYADHEGFRCGTGDSFKVFDFIQRKELNLIEAPLVLMDGTLTGKKYQNKNNDEAIKTMIYYQKISKKYKMQFIILFHNGTLNRFPELIDTYKRIVINGEKI